MKLFLLLLLVVTTAHGYNILCIQTVPSKSHFQLMKGIVDPLLKAGHQVTMITTFPDSKPEKNLKYVDVSRIQKIVPMNVDMMDHNKNQDIGYVQMLARNISRLAIETPAVREMLVNEQFDAVVSEWFFSDVDAGYAAVQQAPWILLSGIVMHYHIEYLVDTVRSVPTIPAFKNDASIPMDFHARLRNTFAYLFMTFGTFYYKRAKFLSKLFVNRPVTTTKLIQHYVELAIESRGAHHLRSKTHLYSWYQIWMLDQIGLLLLILYVIYKVFKKITSFFKKENVKEKQKIN